jgi:putative DNA-invertase from lambdoid prophage Rac
MADHDGQASCGRKRRERVSVDVFRQNRSECRLAWLMWTRGIVIRTAINGITFDGATRDAMQCAIRDALIAFMAATAQAQAEATKEAQRAGIAHAKANGDVHAYKGRKPSYSRKQFESAQAMLGKSASVGEVARITGLTRQTVYRIKDDPVAAESALATWGR